MDDQFNDDYPDIFELEEAAEDPKLPEAIKAIHELFQQSPGRVFYEKQIEILLEKKLYHWITTKALRQLREAGEIRSELENLYSPSTVDLQESLPQNHIRFYFHKQNRYVKRQAEEIKRLVRQFTDQKFTNALGNQGELLVDAALPRAGFMPIAYNVRSHGTRTWTATSHNLDRIFIRDGLAYGIEIKNRLQYISSAEWALKLKMCLHLGLIPLFIARMMPGSYIFHTMKAGGFCLHGIPVLPCYTRSLSESGSRPSRLPSSTAGWYSPTSSELSPKQASSPILAEAALSKFVLIRVPFTSSAFNNLRYALCESYPQFT